MSRLSKEERSQRLREVKAEELAELRESMPLTLQQLDALLNYLEGKLPPCDHTTKHSRSFLESISLDPVIVLPWLGEHGRYCDCEVLFNLEDVVGLLSLKPPSPQKPKQNRPPRSLTNGIGWDLASLPKPWRVANLYSADEPLRLHLGRSNGCIVQLCQDRTFSIDLPDQHWSELWYERTGLPRKGEMLVEHEHSALPISIRSVSAKTAAWTPVFVWIDTKADDWHLEVRSEWSRLAGDLKEIAKLITHYSTD